MQAAIDTLKALELRIRGKLCTARASRFLEDHDSAKAKEKETSKEKEKGSEPQVVL